MRHNIGVVHHTRTVKKIRRNALRFRRNCNTFVRHYYAFSRNLHVICRNWYTFRRPVHNGNKDRKGKTIVNYSRTN